MVKSQDIIIEDAITELTKIGFVIDFTVDANTYMINKKHNIGIEIIPPHHGNGYRWLFRAEFMEVFNKWGNSPYWGYCDELSKIELSDLILDILLLIDSKGCYLYGEDVDFDAIKFRLMKF